MTALKENTELQSKVEEDEDDIDTLTEKNRQLIKQVCDEFCGLPSVTRTSSRTIAVTQCN